MSVIYVILIAIWIIGIPVAYFKFIKNFDNYVFEKVIFSIIWPLLIPLYIIHYFHNKK